MKIALVTGGSRGIGAASAIHLAKGGWHVAVNYRSDKTAADKVVEQCRAAGVESFAVAADVADDDQVRAMFAAVDSELGPVSALVNSAGIAIAPHLRVADMPVDRLRRVFDVNVIGSFLCAAQAITRMSTARGGRGGSIVNVSSVAAKLGSPGEYVDYAAS